MHGLAKLIIYTAGSRGADILIPGLPLEYAEDMRDSLKDLISTEEF
jgi:membrane protein YdbS with pleckstrin-like domain